jgi:hypothetical protein
MLAPPPERENIQIIDPQRYESFLLFVSLSKAVLGYLRGNYHAFEGRFKEFEELKYAYATFFAVR